jgi:nicotinamidase-related amidase
MSIVVDAEPWAWPIAGPVEPARLALVVIDMQHDFVHGDGWFAGMGFDVSALQAAVPVIAGLIEAARARGVTVVHTRQGNAADLSDLPPARLAQGEKVGHPIGKTGVLGRGLVRGEPGWQIVPELASRKGELVVDKPAHSAFWGTDLGDQLDDRGIDHLILTGVTANVCVLSTLFAAVDRGYASLLVTDAIAAVSAATTDVVLDLVRYQGGLLGCAATAAAVVSGLTPRGAP